MSGSMDVTFQVPLEPSDSERSQMRRLHGTLLEETRWFDAMPSDAGIKGSVATLLYTIDAALHGTSPEAQMTWKQLVHGPLFALQDHVQEGGEGLFALYDAAIGTDEGERNYKPEEITAARADFDQRYTEACALMDQLDAELAALPDPVTKRADSNVRSRLARIAYGG